MFKYFIYSLLIVIIGYFGLLLNKKNLIFFLVYLEIIYNGIMLGFLFSSYGSDFSAIVYFLIIMALVASEAVVGLVLTIVYHKVGKNINLENLNSMKG